jgi:hypothetical protein
METNNLVGRPLDYFILFSALNNQKVQHPWRAHFNLGGQSERHTSSGNTLSASKNQGIVEGRTSANADSR